MADITLVDVVDGNVVASSDLMGVFYQDVLASVLTSLSTVNGLLDSDNLAASLTITAEMTQKGSFIDVEGSSGTANLDYRQNWFGNLEWSVDNREFNTVDQIQYVPGGCRTFFLKWPAKVLVFWTVFWEWNNLGDDTERSAMELWIDEEFQDGMIRVLGRLGLTRTTPQGYVKSRCWTGHYLVELDQGWHDVGLRIQSSKAYTTRVHAVSIEVLTMKYGTAT